MPLKYKRLSGNGIMGLTKGPVDRQLNAIAQPLYLGSRLGPAIIRVTFPLYIVCVFLETCGGAIRGAGKALPTMLIIRVNMCIVRIGALKLIMAKLPVAGSVAWVYPIT